MFCRESEREKGRKLILKISKNILDNPTQISKYGNLNFEKINKKLSNCKPALDLLFIAGFVIKTSDNEKRLIWSDTEEHMTILHYIHEILNFNDDQMNTYFSLINEGYTDEEVIDAINLSEY